MRFQNVRNKKKVRKAQAKMSSTRSSQYQRQNGHFTFISWHPAVPHQHRDTFGPKNRVEGPYWPFWKFEGELDPLWKVWGPFWLFCLYKTNSLWKVWGPFWLFCLYKTNSKTPVLGTLTNLMRFLTARLEDGYCSIADHWLITIIRFVAKNYTHP